MGMNNAAINGLCLDERVLARATSGFQVVSVHQSCPQHFGLFFTAEDAEAHASNCNSSAEDAGASARFKIKAWKKAARRR